MELSKNSFPDDVAEEVLSLVTQLQLKWNGNQFVGICPKCGGGKKNEKNFGMGPTGGFRCYRENNCGINGKHPGSFYEVMGWPNPKKGVKRTVQKSKNYKKPPPSTSEGEKCQGFKYLVSRGISPEIIAKYEIVCSASGVKFPMIWGGEQVNFKSRGLGSENRGFKLEAGCRVVPFGMQFVKGSKICFTEGEIDALTLASLGIPNVVSLPNGSSGMTWIDECWDELADFNEIIIFTDFDQAGEKSMEVLIQRLGRHRCRLVEDPGLGLKDANDLHIKGGWGYDEFISLLKGARFVNEPRLVQPSQALDSVRYSYYNKEPFRSTGFLNLDQMLRGIRWGENLVITGYPGCGKSELLNQMIISLLCLGHSICVCSFEYTVSKFYERLVHTLIGKEPVEGKAEIGEIIEAYQWLEQTGLHVIDGQYEDDGLDFDGMMEVFTTAVRRHGCKFVIIDPLTWLIEDEDKTKDDIRRFTKGIKKFQKTENIFAIVVMHPRKSNNDTAIAKACDLYGSGALHIFCDNLWSVWLYAEDPERRKEMMMRKGKKDDADLVMTMDHYLNPQMIGTTWVFNLKQREHGLGFASRMAYFSFDPTTKRHREIFVHRADNQLVFVEKSKPVIGIEDIQGAGKTNDFAKAPQADMEGKTTAQIVVENKMEDHGLRKPHMGRN